ncbi:MAG: nucleotide exchange factor GrpE [Firmicutes bacterium]|nr:nucleotide exchange factor GrpE [Bacillota bacterium]
MDQRRDSADSGFGQTVQGPGQAAEASPPEDAPEDAVPRNGQDGREKSPPAPGADKTGGADGDRPPEGQEEGRAGFAASEEAGPGEEAALQAQMEALRRDHEGLRRDHEELQQRYLRLMADFDNFRRRAQQEKQELLDRAVGDAILHLLPVLDNMERALAAAQSIGGGGKDSNPSASTHSITQGVEMVLRQFRTTLDSLGVEQIPAQPGEAFDPRVHQAVGVEETPEYAEDAIAVELQHGYRFKGRVLRPAMVKVARHPAGPVGGHPDEADHGPGGADAPQSPSDSDGCAGGKRK